MSWVVEPMRPADWEEVRAIYAQGLATRNATLETEVPGWDEWNGSHHPFGRLVARENAVLGWAALAPVSPPRCYAGVAEVSV
jgi:L-amino acid N-acyltransferase YncA